MGVQVRSLARMLFFTSTSSSSSTSSLLLLLLFCTANIHLASGKGENGLEQGHDCKANKLLGELNQLLAEAVAISAPKMSGETVLTTIKRMEKYKKALMKEKRQSGCIGGEEVEANLKPLIEMMKHMVKGAKGDKKALAKLKQETISLRVWGVCFSKEFKSPECCCQWPSRLSL